MAALAMTMLAGCASENPAGPGSASDDDYALVMFGTAGGALESSLGPQRGRPFDGRTGAVRLPAELALTDEQRAAIAELREQFREEHQASLDALRAIFEEARAAREAGASREEVHVILERGRETALALRDDVEALHAAIAAVLTDEQRAWIESHRRRPPDGLPPRGGPRGPGGPPGR